MLAEKPQIGHIGIIVNDVQKCRDAYEKDFGITDFISYDFKPIKVQAYGKYIEDCHLKIALGTLAGGVKLELIQVISGDTPLKRFYDQMGFGVHHINFYTDKYDESKAYYQSLQVRSYSKRR